MRITGGGGVKRVTKRRPLVTGYSEIIGNVEFRTPSNSKAFSIYDLLNAPESNMVTPTGLEPVLPA